MKPEIPPAAVARLPRYLRCLSDMSETSSTCSSEEIALAAGVSAAQVRKDLSYLGSHGTRGVGYEIDELRIQIRKTLGLISHYPVVIVGAGNLGRALAKYNGFDNWGFEITAILDIDESKIGREVAGIKVESLHRLEEIVEGRSVRIGIIATPPSGAQTVADRLTEAGVKSILNLAPTILKTEDDVSVRRVDLSTELGILAYHLTKP
jgi:redox-sensing transcriptional repressor